MLDYKDSFESDNARTKSSDVLNTQETRDWSVWETTQVAKDLDNNSWNSYS